MKYESKKKNNQNSKWPFLKEKNNQILILKALFIGNTLLLEFYIPIT